ncbi:MAG: hypothetical protein DMG75_10380 [Acidobacteria bacterium]|nr:MAG: hypothetical protein DMG75_10380 [Acidobacteriota bacterium]
MLAAHPSKSKLPDLLAYTSCGARLGSSSVPPMHGEGNMYVRLCEFLVRASSQEEFARIYGSDGDWAVLFRRSREFCGTELLRDVETPRRYVTIDRWMSQAAWDSFLKNFGEEYRTLDVACERLNEEEPPLGSFVTVDSGGR